MFKRTTAVNKLLKLSKRIRVIPGGTWAGKTYCILAVEIDYLIKNPFTSTRVVAETIPSVKRGAFRDFKEIMENTARWDVNRYNATERIYTFTNGSTIEFTAYENEDKAKQSGKRNRLLLNEANTISKLIADALFIRTDDVIWLDYNPTATFWVDEELIGKPEVDHLVLTYRDNEALPQTILDELERRREKAKTSEYWDNWCRVYLDGQTGSLEGTVIKDWTEIERLPVDAKGNLECRLLNYGMDFGYTNDPTTLVALYKWNDGYILDEVIYQKGLLNSDISNLLKANNVIEYIYADSAEPKSIAELNAYGHKVEPTKKGADSIIYGVELMNQQKLFVTSRSKNLIKELKSYVWATDKTGAKLNKPVDAFNHAIDAARYAMMAEISDPHRGEYFLY